MDAREAHVREVLAGAFRGRRVVLAGGPVAGSTGRVAALTALGAERCLVLGVGRGTGPLPSDADSDIVAWDLPPVPDVPASIRAEEALFRDPPAPYVDALDRFDPTGEAIVLAPPFSALYELAGRRAYGGRRPEWVALEDKTVADELFTAAGVPTPAFEIVAAAAPALRAAARRLDRGTGTVWAGDAVQGFNGGSAYVHWVVNRADAARAVAHLSPRCERVRVASFVEGIPCSIHGFVTDDGIAVFRPVELITLRRAVAPRLRYAGASTVWDPPTPDRDEMRAAALRVGAVLRERVDFRGAFTVDGILSADGWVANECNPRFGAGLQYVRSASPKSAFDLLHHVVIAGDGSSIAAADIEALVIERADAKRWAATWTPTTSARWTESNSLALRGDAAGFEPAAEDDTVDATLTYGPGHIGGFVRCEFVAERIPPGESCAPRAVTALAFADTHCGAGIGSLSPAVPVR
jgi:hypothetical protein